MIAAEPDELQEEGAEDHVNETEMQFFRSRIISHSLFINTRMINNSAKRV